MKKFKRFTHRQVKSLKIHLKKYSHSRKPKTLHQIRIDIKKIKLILGVIGDSIKHFQKHKNFVSFRKIFRRANEIRESDIQNQLLLHYTAKGFLENSKTDKSGTVKSFISDIPIFIKIVKNQEKKLEVRSKEIRRNDLYQYLRKKINEADSQLYPKLRMTTIHKTRKTLKEIIFLSEIENMLGRGEAKFYNRIQDIIGQLRDKQMILSLLRNKKDKISLAQRALINAASVSDKKQMDRLISNYYR